MGNDDQLSMDLGVDVDRSEWAKWVDPARQAAQARKFMDYAGIRRIPSKRWEYDESNAEQRSADSAVAELFPNMEAVRSPDHADMTDALICFLGECFAKYAGAEWHDNPMGRENSLYKDVNPVLRYGFEGAPDHTAAQLMEIMLEKREEYDGLMFSAMLDMMAEYEEECRFNPRGRGPLLANPYD